MNSEVSKRLQKMLELGWEVRGFQPIIDGDQIGDNAAASTTTGYAILLQGAGKLAVLRIVFDKGRLIANSIEMLTGAD